MRGAAGHLLGMVLELANSSGIVLRRDVIAAGYDDNALARHRRQGTLVRVRQGAYVQADLWSQRDPADQHRILCQAVMLQYGDHVALSHESACVVQGGPTWGLDLSAVHLTHFHDEHAGRKYAGIVHHEGSCRVDDLSRDGAGNWITSPTRTVLDTAARNELKVGVCVADDFARRGLTSEEHLRRGHGSMRTWPDTLHNRRVIDLMDPRSESVGETLSRLFLRAAGLPIPVVQYEVFHPNGVLAGRCDLALPEHGLLIEFDGKIKYHRYRREGETIEEMVLREKAREDMLRELTDMRMIRLVWADLYRPKATEARIRRKLSKKS